jgi:alpha-ribazole phosphatase
MQCVLIRHPAMLHTQGQCYGRLDVTIAADVLQHSATQLADLSHLPVYSSPAQRCLQLAQRLSKQATVWPELQELDFGQWEGLAWDDIPRADLDAWAADIWHYRVGNTGETAHELRQRWQQAYQQLLALNLPKVVLISHAGLIRMALAEAQLITEHARWTHPIAYATPYLLEL